MSLITGPTRPAPPVHAAMTGSVNTIHITEHLLEPRNRGGDNEQSFPGTEVDDA